MERVNARADAGTLSVDGRVLSQQKMEHTIPFLMTIDESLDIGLDTRSPVDESYALPFRFAGTIDKLTYVIRPEQLSAADRDEFNRVVAAARDTPAR